jgi:hypothetical protein
MGGLCLKKQMFSGWARGHPPLTNVVLAEGMPVSRAFDNDPARIHPAAARWDGLRVGSCLGYGPQDA